MGQTLATAVPVLAAVLSLAPLVQAQDLPSTPISLAGGRITLGGDVSVSAATNDDDPGWFNYTDYEHNVLRMVRLALSARVRANERVAVLAEVRSENWDAVRPYALYARIRPWPARAIDVQVGRIPPIFGAFARRSYGWENPLVGYPLAYQYLTSLRSDAIPATADDLLRMRGRGWLASYPVGSSTADRGVPLVTAFRWDTGVQVRLGGGPIEAAAAVTNGTLSNPRVEDDNAGKQMSGRLAVRPALGLLLGASAARGPYLSDTLAPLLPSHAPIGRFVQTAFGFDTEYSRSHWLIRSETIISEWRLPALAAPAISEPVRATAFSVEGRYKLWPGLYAAARYDYLGFSRLAGSRATRTWDAPVERLEVGGGYYLRRNLLMKGVFQRNWRDGGAVRTLSVGAWQLQFWL